MATDFSHLKRHDTVTYVPAYGLPARMRVWRVTRAHILLLGEKMRFMRFRRHDGRLIDRYTGVVSLLGRLSLDPGLGYRAEMRRLHCEIWEAAYPNGVLESPRVRALQLLLHQAETLMRESGTWDAIPVRERRKKLKVFGK